jgi:hypothetical protein
MDIVDRAVKVFGPNYATVPRIDEFDRRGEALTRNLQHARQAIPYA